LTRLEANPSLAEASGLAVLRRKLPSTSREDAPMKLEPNRLHHPAVLDQAAKRASDLQLRIADQITSFAGSMKFVYIHAIVFVTWMLVLEKNPWPTLTLAVSLEAIFLS